MAIGRETIGIVLVALTASSVVTAFIAGERPSRVVEVVENSFPSEIRDSQWNTFSLVVVARRPLERLDLQYSCLHQAQVFASNITQGRPEREAMAALSPVSDLLIMARGLGMQPVQSVVQVVANKSRRDAYVIDFSAMLRPSMDDPVLGDYFGSGANTIYAGILDDSGQLVLYAGVRDFFHARNVTIMEMSLSLNDEKSVFKRARDLSPSERAAKAPDMVDAPAVGTVSFSGLKKDDTVRLVFSLDSSAAGYGSYVQIIRIFADGKLEEEITNFLPKAR